MNMIPSFIWSSKWRFLLDCLVSASFARSGAGSGTSTSLSGCFSVYNWWFRSSGQACNASLSHLATNLQKVSLTAGSSFDLLDFASFWTCWSQSPSLAHLAWACNCPPASSPHADWCWTPRDASTPYNPPDQPCSLPALSRRWNWPSSIAGPWWSLSRIGCFAASFGRFLCVGLWCGVRSLISRLWRLALCRRIALLFRLRYGVKLLRFLSFLLAFCCPRSEQ